MLKVVIHKEEFCFIIGEFIVGNAISPLVVQGSVSYN